MKLYLVNCYMGFVAATECVAFALGTSYESVLNITNQALDKGEQEFFEGSETECLALKAKMLKFAEEKQKEEPSLLYTNLTIKMA